jgi:F0F1-type ATP synthase membrane subunit c/vacuolar-type H+-ATPase subunit K
MQIVWGALLASVLLYVGLGFFMFPRELPLRLDTLADFSVPLKIPFIGTSGMALAMSTVLPKILLGAVVKKRVSKRPLEMPEMAQLFFVPLVIRLALLESVTLYGFVLVQTQRDPVQALPFALVTLAGFSLHFPSEARIAETFRSL